MNNKPLVHLAVLLAMLSGTARLHAQNTNVTYQGRVRSGGTDFTGTGQFKFALVTGVDVSARATATAVTSGNFVTIINVTFGGNGYVAAPAVTITGGGGSGATATASVSGGVVTFITVNNPGSGYSSVPTVTIAPPSENISYTTYWSNDGTSNAGSEPAAAVSVPVSSGLFTVRLGDTALANMTPLGAGLFAQPNLQLRIWFNDGVNGFSVLNPAQRLTAAPYALTAASVAAGGIPAGTYGNALTLNNPANNFSGSFTGNGSGLANVNAATLGGMNSSSFWRVGGNAGTTPGPQFLGTTDNQPLELKVNNQRGLRLEPTVIRDTVNVIGGSTRNFVRAGVLGATIGGGGSGEDGGFISKTNRVEADFGTVSGGANAILSNASYATIAGGGLNIIETNAFGASIGGGLANTIKSGAFDATIAGGNNNLIEGEAFVATIAGGVNNTTQTYQATIGGGYANTIQTSADFATIGGGINNVIQTAAGAATIAGGDGNSIRINASLATIAGGYANTIQTAASFATIGGGRFNTIQPNAFFAIIPGGRENSAASYAFAAGNRAKANHTGAFIWADSSDFDFPSTAENKVRFRCSSGFDIITAIDGLGNQTAGVYLPPGAGSWLTVSDRHAKENLVAVNADEVLEKVTALPLHTWNYKSQDASIRHIGPMAQDFKAAFGLGESETAIATVDADGVALAAIQGLNEKVDVRSQRLEFSIQQLEAEVKSKDARIAELERRLATIEALLQK